MKKVILLTGIHGVGKGYISNRIKEIIDIPVYEASKLIKQTGNDSDENKKVANIPNNQELLKYAIENYVKEDLFILDGHTCLLDKERKIQVINQESLTKLNVIGVIYIYDDTEVIKERLYKRDGTEYDDKLLYDFQSAECENSEKLAKKLNVRFIKYKNSDNINPIINYLKDFN